MRWLNQSKLSRHMRNLMVLTLTLSLFQYNFQKRAMGEPLQGNAPRTNVSVFNDDDQDYRVERGIRKTTGPDTM